MGRSRSIISFFPCWDQDKRWILTLGTTSPKPEVDHGEVGLDNPKDRVIEKSEFGHHRSTIRSRQEASPSAVAKSDRR